MDMNKLFGVFPDQLNELVDTILGYATVLASVATVTMALLELIKSLFNLRLRYHKNKIKQWIENNSEVYNDLIVLAVSNVNSSGALFDQSTDKMMAQIQSAANMAVDYPDAFPALYNFLTYDLSVRTAYIKDNSDTYGDVEIWYNFITKKPSDNFFTEKNYENSEEVKAATKARVRIDHFIDRKLDAFQTSTEYRWAVWNQYLSVIASSTLLAYFLIQTKVAIIPSVAIALFGGMMAPLAKDVVNALSGLKNKS